MNIGVPKEVSSFEYRVGLTPAMVQLLCQNRHQVFLEHDAGLGAGFHDQDYEQAGAIIKYAPDEVFGRADTVFKIARPTLDEIEWMNPGSTLVGLLHLASTRQDKIQRLLDKKITTIAYEQIQLDNGILPVLKPLSQIGGRLATQIGARLLQNNAGGKGILLGGIAGIPPAEVVIVGAGVVGSCAAKGFIGMGAHVTVLDSNLASLQALYEHCQGLVTMISNPINLARACQYADIVVGAVLVPGEATPVLITREMIRSMKPRSVVMDISIDEGGCIETSRPTTHEQSTFIEEGIIHYCVPNIPSVVARTSTYALTNAAYGYIVELVNKGVESAISTNSSLERAVNTHLGKLVHLNRPLG